MSDIIFGIIISGLLAGGFGILGIWVGHYLNKKSTMETLDIAFNKAIDFTKIQDFNKAAAEFKIAFSKELAWMKTEPIDASTKIAGKLNAAFRKHSDAAIKFRSFLPDGKLAEFDKACDNYYYPDKKNKKPGHGYARIVDQKKSRDLAKKNIKCLHKYTDPQFVFDLNTSSK